RQALATIFGLSRQATPAGLAILPVGFLEAGRRGDLAVIPFAALAVADLVQRRGNLRHELAAFLENGVDHVAAGVSEAELVAQLLHLQHIVQDELEIPDRCGIARHRSLSSISSAGACPW